MEYAAAQELDPCHLATIVARGLPAEAELADAAQGLARFHRDAARRCHIGSQASAFALSHRWLENLSGVRRVAGTAVPSGLIEQVEHLAQQYLGGRVVLFTQRIIDGRIVDRHGDQLRSVDGIDEAASFALDLEFLGRTDLSDYFLDCYSRYADDHAPASLKHFYLAHRAVMRANAEYVGRGQGQSDAAQDATRYLSLAVEHLTAATVRLALIGGQQGTGKTTLADLLAERVGAEVISIDQVHDELQQSNSIRSEGDIAGDGWCAANSASAVYAIATRRAHTALANGRSVILDATWRDPRQRSLAEALATETRSVLVEIVCTPPGDVAVSENDWGNAHRICTWTNMHESVNAAERVWRSAV